MLGCGFYSQYLRDGGDEPIVYSAIGGSEGVNAAIEAATAWRTGDIPHPLKAIWSHP
jgi:hypothetical protein